jgi:hypothetical protein
MILRIFDLDLAIVSAQRYNRCPTMPTLRIGRAQRGFSGRTQ